jgi:hypothetical protein
VSFGAAQADIHVVVVAVNGPSGPATISTAVTAKGSGTGTGSSLTLGGGDPARTIVTVVHAVKEGSQPQPGLGAVEVADTTHGSMPSGMGTAWWPDAFVPTPAYTWKTPAPWGALAFELGSVA